MGYFSNGSEGDLYRARYCDRCLHGQETDGKLCAVWDAHLLYCYGATAQQAAVLDELIPRNGISNGECRMFVLDPGQRSVFA